MKCQGHFNRVTLILLVIIPWQAWADYCVYFDKDTAAVVRDHVREGMVALQFCESCGFIEPLPLRIRSLELREHSVDVDFITYNGRKVTLADIDKGTLVADYTPEEIEFLRETLEEQAARKSYTLHINGEEIDLAYFYIPEELPVYRNVGVLAHCAADISPTIEYVPINKDPALEAPMQPILVDVSEHCYDGCCPGKTWTVREKVILFAEANVQSAKVAELSPGASVTPLQVRAFVEPVRAEVVYDHGRFFEGDVFYLLNSLGEGFYNIWYYSKTHEEDVSGINQFQLKMDRRGCNPPTKDCWAVAGDLKEETWWAEVRRKGGQAGWLYDPRKTMDGVLVCD